MCGLKSKQEGGCSIDTIAIALSQNSSGPQHVGLAEFLEETGMEPVSLLLSVQAHGKINDPNEERLLGGACSIKTEMSNGRKMLG